MGQKNQGVLIKMNYIYKDNYAIGYIDGTREVLFTAPIPMRLLIS